MALFNDAVYAYRRMKQADTELNNDSSLLASFCDDDERNTLAFAELHQYNKDSTFNYQHPILAGQNLLMQLRDLLRTDPMAFMTAITNSTNNIARYQGRIANNKYRDEAERLAWLAIIHKEQAKLKIMQSLISNTSNENNS